MYRSKNKAIAGRRNRVHQQYEPGPIILRCPDVSEAEIAKLSKDLLAAGTSNRWPVIVANPDVEIIRMRKGKSLRIIR